MARSQFTPGEYTVWGTVRVDSEYTGPGTHHYLECHGSRHIASGLATTGTWFRPRNLEIMLRQGVIEAGKSYAFILNRTGLYTCHIVKVDAATTPGQIEQMHREAERARKAAKQSMPERQAEASRFKATEQQLKSMYAQSQGFVEQQMVREQVERVAEAFQVPSELVAPELIEIAETVESITYEPLATPAETSLDKLLSYMTALNHKGHHINIMLVGPAGCGKSAIVKMAAEQTGRPFYFTSFSRDTPPWELTGRSMPGADGQWAYQASEFVKAYEQGGVWLGDEFDAADANTLLVLNAALANGEMVVPGREDTIVRRHPEFVAIAAANTYGSGSRVYVGREELDEATMDRFLTISVDYDQAYEGGLLAASDAGQEIGKVITAIRSVIDGQHGEKPLRRTCSTRRIIDWTAATSVGRDLGELLEEYFASWSTVDRQKALSNAAVRSAMSSRIAPAAAPVTARSLSYR